MRRRLIRVASFVVAIGLAGALAFARNTYTAQAGSGKLRLIGREKPIRVIASASFDSKDPRVKPLSLEAATTHAGERIVSVDVVGLGYHDDFEYRSRVVVAQIGSDWYAMPRCASSDNFHAIADSMQHTPTAAPNDR